MAYEDIDVGSLRSSLLSLKNISTNKISLEKVKDSINGDEWSGQTKNRIKAAIVKTTKYYSVIDKYIDKLLKATDYIEKYKELDKENDSYDNKIDNTNNKISNLADDEDPTSLKNERDRYKNKINANNDKKSALKAKINELIEWEASI